MPNTPTRAVPSRSSRSIASLASRLRNSLVEALGDRAADGPSRNGDGGGDSRTDGEFESRTGVASGHAVRDRRLPDVPDPYHDTALDVLAHPWSRYVFYYVRDRAHRSVSVATLTDDLLEWLPDDAEDVARSDVAEALWEHHLPALAAQGLVRVDRDAGTVRYVERDGIEEALAAQAGWDPNELLSRP